MALQVDLQDEVPVLGREGGKEFVDEVARGDDIGRIRRLPAQPRIVEGLRFLRSQIGPANLRADLLRPQAIQARCQREPRDPVGQRRVTLVLVQPGKELHQDFLDNIVLVIPPGQIGPDDPRDDRVEVPDKLLCRAFIALLPPLQARINIDNRLHSNITLPAGETVR